MPMSRNPDRNIVSTPILLKVLDTTVSPLRFS